MGNSPTNDGRGNVRELEQREALIRWARRLAACAIFTVIAFAGYRGYAAWRKNHLARQTADFVAQSDYQSAVLVARRLLELDPENPVACRAMAEMAEKTGQTAAVSWRQRLTQREPSAANQIALAKTAIRFGQGDLAEHVLQSMPESSRQSAAYQQVAAADALAHQDPAAAETHFAAALALAPNDPQLAVNLAILHLASDDPKIAADARLTLETLSREPKVHLAASRALTALALAHEDRAAARKWATELQSDPAGNFADALLHFQSLEGTDAAPAALTALEAKAAASAATVAELLPWMNRHGLTSEAIAWAASLPAGIREAYPVPLAIAESYSLREDWSGLRASIEGKNWGEFEALRLAVESHALHRLNGSERPSAETENAWRAALKAAQSHPEQLISIAQMTQGWGYNAEAEEAWWLVANGKAGAKTGLAALQNFYQCRQDTRGLLRVARRALELNPGDLVAANNCASFGLLLTGDSTARRLAAKLHAEHPANRVFAATYAYALQTEGKLTEALELMETLKEEELRQPAIAAYYVVMLVESGRLDRARSYLPAANRAALLPEERQLLAAAVRKLLPETPGVARM